MSHKNATFHLRRSHLGNVLKWLRFWRESFTLLAPTQRRMGTCGRGDTRVAGRVAGAALPMAPVTQPTRAISRIAFCSHKEVKYKGKLC